MSIKWDIKTELVNDETQLRRITATRVDDADPGNIIVHAFFIKARMKTTEERNAVWINIRRQYLDSIRADVDTVATEGRVYLDEKEVS